MTSMDKVLMSAIETVENRVDAITAGSDSSSSSTVLAHTHAISDITNLQTNLDTINNDITTLKKSGDTFNPFKDKWVSILGDSISTFPGYIPDGMIANDHDGFDTVDKEWWHILLTKLGAKLCVNYSCSGMKLSGTDSKLSACYKQYATKLHRVAGNTYPNLDSSTSTPTEDINPDIIFVYLGTNDFTGNATMTEFEYSDMRSEMPETSNIASEKYADVKYAYMFLLMDILRTYPYATIYCITPQTIKTASTSYPFTNDSTWAMTNLDELVRQLCVKFAAKQISLIHCGIRGNGAFVGSDKFLLSDGIHPTTEGHKLIAKACYYSMINDPVSWNTRNEI